MKKESRKPIDIYILKYNKYNVAVWVNFCSLFTSKIYLLTWIMLAVE